MSSSRSDRMDTVALELRFRDAQAARPCLTRLLSLPGDLLKNLRGRVTAHEAVYQVVLSGQGTQVAEAVWSLQATAVLLRGT